MNNNNANNNNNNNNQPTLYELRLNMIFNVLSILTNTFNNTLTMLSIGNLNVRIIVNREVQFFYGMEGATETNHDQELFMSMIST